MKCCLRIFKHKLRNDTSTLKLGSVHMSEWNNYMASCRVRAFTVARNEVNENSWVLGGLPNKLAEICQLGRSPPCCFTIWQVIDCFVYISIIITRAAHFTQNAIKFNSGLILIRLDTKNWITNVPWCFSGHHHCTKYNNRKITGSNEHASW